MKKTVSTSIIVACLLATSSIVVAQTMPYHQSQQMRNYQAAQPMTEEMLKQRLNIQHSFTKHQLAIDKKLADAYAEKFARHQKQQADALAQMMKQAEKQREYTLRRLEMQQLLILKRFSQFQVSQDKIK